MRKGISSTHVLGLTLTRAIFLEFNGIVLLVVGDVPLDRETSVVTFSENPNPNLVKAVIGVGEDASVES